MIHSSDVLQSARGMNWSDVRELSGEANAFLARLAHDPDWLQTSFDRMFEDAHLRSLSEQLAELDKIVLFDDPQSGVRIRLHVFRQGYYDRPHNHRFNFATRLLHGEYTHTIYGNEPPESELENFAPIPRLIRHERAGDGYLIEHTLVHSVAAVAQTITLTVRGPSQKDRMLIVDDNLGTFFVYGVAQEDPEVVAKRRLTDERLCDIRELLTSLDIIPLAVR